MERKLDRPDLADSDELQVSTAAAAAGCGRRTLPQLLDHLARAQQQRLRGREIAGKPSAGPATSSTIRTGQGVEVIVPNADLVSKQVTNWRLYDRAHRYEIDVGVEYGSDPARVLRLLEDAPAGIDMAATLKT